MLQRFPWALAIVFLSVPLAGCGLFSDDPEDDPLDIIIKESVPVEFRITDDALCEGLDCSGEPMPVMGDPIELPPIEVPTTVDVVELTGNSELRDASERLKRVEIESIDYIIGPNTLNIESPPLEIYLGPPTATSKDAQSVVLLGELPAAPPMTEDEGNVPVSQEAQDAQSELFQDLEFTVIGFGQKTIEQGEMFPPKGDTDYTMNFNMKFSLSPTEQF